MEDSKHICAAAGLIAAGSRLITAPSASAAKANLESFFDRALREVINVGKQGDSHGDSAVMRGGKAVGSYSASQITTYILIPGRSRELVSRLKNLSESA